MKTTILLSLISILAFISCDKSEVKCSEPKEVPGDCSPDVMCTADFRYITLNLKDQNGNPVLLDKVISLKSRTGEQIIVDDLKNEFSLKQGDYIVWSDAQKDKTKRDGDLIQLVGYKNGAEIVKQNFTIGHNCCHIEKKDGPSELVVSVNSK
jgi:hypothetical protein